MDTRIDHSSLYDVDEHEWLRQQAALLAAGRLSDIDALNLSEYLESMGRSEEREVRSRLVVLLHHLLKARFQPEMATRSWLVTVLTQQQELRDILEDSATLARKAGLQFDAAYGRARSLAAAETGLALQTFPTSAPWTLEEALSTDPQPMRGNPS